MQQTFLYSVMPQDNVILGTLGKHLSMLRLFKKKLPHCDSLFEKFLSPWYPEEDRPRMTRPDMYQIAAYEGQPLNLEAIQYLDEEPLAYQRKHLNETMVQAASEDFKHITNADQLDLNALESVDKYYDRAKIADLIKESNPIDFSNPYLVTVCEFGAMLGYLFKQISGFDWLYSHPYFHSIIVYKDTGIGITVFDWSVKKFSEYGVDDDFAAKFKMALENIRRAG